MKWNFNKKRINRTVTTGDIFENFLEEFGLQKEFDLEKLVNMWSELTGNIISSHSKPDRVFKHTLFIKADHPIFSNDIDMMSRELLKKINNIFVNCQIKKIKVEIKKDFWR